MRIITARRAVSARTARSDRHNKLSRAIIETVEQRRLLSFSFGVGGVANFTGDPGGNTFTVRRDGSGTFYQFLDNNVVLGTGPVGSFTHINASGGIGNDTLIVDSSNGLITAPIQYDGGAGFNQLTLTQTGGTTASSDVYSPGPGAGDGTSTIVGLLGTQSVAFSNLAPMIDTVPAASLTVNATNAANSINYTNGAVNPATNGLVSVDNFETIEFSNKAQLIINALAGADAINLHNSITPTGLTGITVNGGDPTGSVADTLTVNGLSNQLDNLRFKPTATGAGTVFNDNAPQPNVNLTGIEALQLVVEQADGDGVRVDGTLGNDIIQLTPGATSDSGSFSGTLNTNGALFTMVPTTYIGVNSAANDQDVNFFNPGGTDTFMISGSSADDNFTVGIGEAGGTQFADTVNGVLVARAEAFNIMSGVVFGQGGDDRLTVNGVFGQLDNLRYAPTGAGAGMVINDSGFQTPIAFVGLEHLNLALQAADGDGARVDGTTGNDSIEFTPGGTAGFGTFTGTLDQNNTTGSGPFALVPTTFTGNDPALNDEDVNFFTPGGSDTFTFNGTAAGETISVGPGEAGGTEFRITNGATIVQRVEVFNLESALVRAGGGSDTINVGVTAPLVNGLTVDGGDAIGTTDTLNVSGNGTAMTANFGGPAGTTIGGGGLPLTALVGIENANIDANGGALTVLGTVGADHISYTPATADGGLVTRDDSLLQLGFSNVGGAFTIDPLAGNDTVEVVGTAAADTFDVQVHATTTAQVGGTKMVQIPTATVELFKLSGLAGSDIFNVTVFNDGTLHLLVDGGLPPAGKPEAGDVLNVIAGSKPAKIENKKAPAPAVGSGFLTSVYPTASQLIDYTNVEKVVIKK